MGELYAKFRMWKLKVKPTRCPNWHELPKSTIFIADRFGLHNRIFSGFKSQWIIFSSETEISIINFCIYLNWNLNKYYNCDCNGYSYLAYLKTVVPYIIVEQISVLNLMKHHENLYYAGDRINYMTGARIQDINDFATWNVVLILLQNR